MTLNARTLIALSLLALLAGCAKSPESRVQAFYEAIEAREFDTAMSMLHPELLQFMPGAKIHASLAMDAALIERCGGLQNVAVTFTEETETARRGTVQLTYRREECKPKSGKVILKKAGKQWLITA